MRAGPFFDQDKLRLEARYTELVNAGAQTPIATASLAAAIPDRSHWSVNKYIARNYETFGWDVVTWKETAWCIAQTPKRPADESASGVQKKGAAADGGCVAPPVPRCSMRVIQSRIRIKQAVSQVPLGLHSA